MLKICELRVCQWICVLFCLSVYLSVSVAFSLFLYVYVWRNEQQFKISPRERIKLHNENPFEISCNTCNGYYPSYVACFPFVLLECHNLVAVFVVTRASTIFFVAFCKQTMTCTASSEKKYSKTVLYWSFTTPNGHSKCAIWVAYFFDTSPYINILVVFINIYIVLN